MRILIITIYFISLSALALEGAVVVLEAPLFSIPDEKAKIVQYVRKNSVINIHNKHAPPLMYQLYDEPILKEMSTAQSKFFTTLDRTGKTAYILKDHVKLIYNDIREFHDKSPLRHDPTDYRLAEPLPENFPLQKSEQYKATVSIGVGGSDKVSYPYPTTAEKEDFSLNKIIALSYAKKVKFDVSNRLYFGVMVYYQQGNNQFKLGNFTTAKETSWQLGIGPYLSYLAFRNNRFHLYFYGGISYGYAKSSIQIKHPYYSSFLERSFTGNAFKGRLGLQFTHKFLPKIDMTLSAQLEGTLPYGQTSNDFQQNTSVWNGANDKISHSSILNMSMLAGIIAYY